MRKKHRTPEADEESDDPLAILPSASRRDSRRNQRTDDQNEDVDIDDVEDRDDGEEEDEDEEEDEEDEAQAQARHSDFLKKD